MDLTKWISCAGSAVCIHDSAYCYLDKKSLIEPSNGRLARNSESVLLGVPIVTGSKVSGSGKIHCWPSAQCLLKSEWKIMNFEPSNGRLARHSESVLLGVPTGTGSRVSGSDQIHCWSSTQCLLLSGWKIINFRAVGRWSCNKLWNCLLGVPTGTGSGESGSCQIHCWSSAQNFFPSGWKIVNFE